MNGVQVLEELKLALVAKYLGHCGATPNRYVAFEGTKAECQKYLDSLPWAGPEDLCSHCGGYSYTGAVRDVCYIEDVD